REDLGAGIRMAVHGRYLILFRTNDEAVRSNGSFTPLVDRRPLCEGSREDQAPATVKSSIRKVGESAPVRNSRSLAAVMRANISLRLPATVISLTGWAIWPFSIQNPAAPRL